MKKRPLYDPVAKVAHQRKLKRKRDKKYWASPRGKYARHKVHARQRGIEWLFTFESWKEEWMKDPKKWRLRGNKKGQYCMARFSDSGPYGLGRVKIVRIEANSYASLHRASGHNFNPAAKFAPEAAEIL